jgi:peptide-methionine (S)-S-oxide reductase
MTEKATFAAGCFWGVESAFRRLEGVVSTSVGYTGGHVPDPTYEMVCNKGTGHAEAVEVTYDPQRISYEDLLETFWSIHDPTQVNRQGPDVGDQYRSAIFFHGPEQEAAARASKARLEEERRFPRPIATRIEPRGAYYLAEDYHQQYEEKHRSGVRALFGL